MTPRRWLASVLDLAATGLHHLAERLDGPARWCIHITDGGTHEYPLRDAVEHGPDPECVCGPSAELETCEDHGDAWLFRHHPLTQTDQLEDYTLST